MRPFRSIHLFAAATLAAACSRADEGDSSTSDAVVSTKGVVVSASAPASDIGASILRAGGNAVDAAVATGLALAVTYPAAGNIGGGGFMVIRLADGTATTIDYRERAPLRATERMYLDRSGAIDWSLIEDGYLAPGVPGTVRGLALAHRKHGRLPWRQVVEPAAELARRGFPVSKSLAGELNWLVDKTRSKFPETVRAYGKPGGGAWAAGDTLRLPDLGRALASIAIDGPDAFYTGWIADSLAAAMAAHGGIITRDDLAQYQPVERAPVRGSFLGAEILAMAPPSSGGVAMIEMLNILEALDIARRERFAPTTLHLMIEAQRRAYLDRAEFLGDPDFVTVPVERLTSKEHAQALAASIDTTRATSSVALAAGRIPVAPPAESDHTTHFSVVDAEGNAVANTYTLEAGYGSRVAVSGAGFILNNEMGDFNKNPGVTTAGGDIGTAANLIVPGKRMLSSMTPTIVTKDGKTLAVTGSPGGRTIINTVHQIVLNVVAFGMDARAAIDAPRFHSQWLPDQVHFEAGAVPPATVTALEAMGHRVKVGGSIGDGHTIVIDPKTGRAAAAADRRTPDSKAATP